MAGGGEATGVEPERLSGGWRAPGGRRQGGSDRAEIADLDRAAFEQLRGLGQDFLVAFVADFRRQVPDDLAHLGQGLADADADGASRSAHRLKGTCLMLGASRMAALAADVERAAAGGALDRAADLVPALERSFDDLVAALEASV